MGTCECTRDNNNNNIDQDNNRISIQHFKKLYVVGKGGFGRVWKVLKRNAEVFAKNKTYALKEMSKAKIFHKNSIHLIQNERLFLEKLNFVLLVNMHYAFETNDYLYIVMDYLSGGDLRYYLSKGIRYTEQQIRFIITNIILSLQYIHSKGIIHRDIKPENLVFDSKGYLHLTDFGVGHEFKIDEEIIDSSGTPGYMAPEALMKKPHGFAVDFFSLGVLIYELIFGERPYVGRNRKEIKQQMICKEIEVKEKDLPVGWEDVNVVGFVNGLLKRKAQERLGKGGVKEVIGHPWLKEVDWEGIRKGNVKSPIEIYGEMNFNEEYVNRRDLEEFDKETKEYYISVVNDGKCFRRFYFDRYCNRSNNHNKHNNDKYKLNTGNKKTLNTSKSNTVLGYSFLGYTKINSTGKGNIVVYSYKDGINGFKNEEQNTEKEDELL